MAKQTTQTGRGEERDDKRVGGFGIILKMQYSETKVFRDFPKVGTFVPNDGSPTSSQDNP